MENNFVHLMTLALAQDFLVHGESKIQLWLWESIPSVKDSPLVVDMKNQRRVLMLARIKKKFLQLFVKKNALQKTVHH